MSGLMDTLTNKNLTVGMGQWLYIAGLVFIVCGVTLALGLSTSFTNTIGGVGSILTGAQLFLDGLDKQKKEKAATTAG